MKDIEELKAEIELLGKKYLEEQKKLQLCKDKAIQQELAEHELRKKTMTAEELKNYQVEIERKALEYEGFMMATEESLINEQIKILTNKSNK